MEMPARIFWDKERTFLGMRQTVKVESPETTASWGIRPDSSYLTSGTAVNVAQPRSRRIKTGETVHHSTAPFAEAWQGAPEGRAGHQLPKVQSRWAVWPGGRHCIAPAALKELKAAREEG